MPRPNQKKDNRDSDSRRPSVSGPDSSEESRDASNSSRSHGSSDRSSRRRAPETFSELWGLKKTPRERNERERQSSKSERSGSTTSSKRTHFTHYSGEPKPRSMWDVISTIVNSPKPKKDERQGYWVRGSKGTMMAFEKPGESSRRASHRKPKRGERSPSDEVRNSPPAKSKYSSEDDISAPLRPSRNAARTLGELKPPKKSRIDVVGGEGVVEENDSFISIEGKIAAAGSNFFVIITESYTMLVNIPNYWDYKTITGEFQDVYHALSEYRTSHPTASPGCMWLVKGVYNDLDENGQASLVNFDRYHFLTDLITNMSDFNWEDSVLQHGSFVVEKGGDVNITFSIGVFAQPYGPPRLQVTDFKGTRYLEVDRNESIPRKINGKSGTNPFNDPHESPAWPAANHKKAVSFVDVNPDESNDDKKEGTDSSSFNPTKSPLNTLGSKKSTNPLSDPDKNTPKTINGKKGTKPSNDENGANHFDYLDKNTSKTINGKKGTLLLDDFDENIPKPTNDENGTLLLDDFDENTTKPTNYEHDTTLLDDFDEDTLEPATNDKKTQKKKTTDDNNNNNNKEEADTSSFNPAEDTPNTNHGGGKKGAKKRNKKG
ncbi:uncharacterized protein TRUGW13939_05745 [Talaromyces rugulosus]|uniref:Uncharacterized protein n=1 Tax=Talaromyces rugulosus TaxID=121627 RepID=A0A7H8QX08_TALRU|nr:uncharacterized protein TRUGW13939_05745 [Talaromyces rugulosus]QKX58620.1 hypothetical protein TRUGW13939_05745 [Talaromyces rugulosus]